jgi:hypothetical protein
MSGRSRDIDTFIMNKSISISMSNFGAKQDCGETDTHRLLRQAGSNTGSGRKLPTSLIKPKHLANSGAISSQLSVIYANWPYLMIRMEVR